MERVERNLPRTEGVSKRTPEETRVKVKNLRVFGFTNAEIAQILELNLQTVKNIASGIIKAGEMLPRHHGRIPDWKKERRKISIQTIRLREKGLTNNQIAQKLGISKLWIEQISSRFLKFGLISPRPRGRRPIPPRL